MVVSLLLAIFAAAALRTVLTHRYSFLAYVLEGIAMMVFLVALFRSITNR